MVLPEPPADSLQALLEGDEPPWDESPEPPPDPDRANAMLVRLARIKRQLADDELRADTIIAQASRWKSERIALHGRQIAWLETSLAGWGRGVYERTGAMSVQLPAGAVTSQVDRPEWIYDDEDAFLAWAREHAPGAVRHLPDEIDRNEAKRLLTIRDAKGKPLKYGVTPDGERPPGLRVKVPDPKADRTFTVKPNMETEGIR